MTELAEIKSKLEKDLQTALEKQKHNKESVSSILDAFHFAFDKHINQKRKSGEPYIVHPVAVGIELANLKCDKATISAGILHDVLEDTETSPEELINRFGKDIYELVDGVTKLGKLNFKSSEQEQANNFRKMLMAIAQDMRVVLIKLSDRVNNMHTLQHLAPEKQRRIAKETLDIFAPLANRFGLNTIKIELEDLCFKYLYPNEYEQVKKLVSSKRSERESLVKIIQEKIREILLKHNIEAEISGRAKHFYSIFKKLRDPVSGRLNLSDEEDLQVYDLLGIRIIVNDIKDCYAVLGLVHENFRPMPGRFKDYIAVPKSNLYQSLHTTVITPFGKPLEVQIRTHEMHEIAENGIAAHWFYKESDGSNQAQAKEVEELAWIRQLITWQTDVEDAQEYVDAVKKDILSQEVYILTPKGDVYTLPIDSTPVDFAYKIHSKVGDTCTGAKVNDKMVPINYKLQNGDLVEIITSKNAHPNLSWLNFIKTSQAKHRIKSWYKKQNRDRHIQIGKQMLEEKVGKEGFDQFLNSDELLEVSQKLNYKTADDLIASIGSGDTTVSQVIAKLHGTKYGPHEEQDLDQKKFKAARKAPVKGDDADIPELDGLLYNIAKCCMPVPGESVIGVVSKGKGITIHRAVCNNLRQVEDDRIIRVDWKAKADKTYPTNLLIEVVDRVGVVKDLLILIADAGINVSDFKVKERPSESTALLRLVLNVTSQEQLLRTTTSLKNMSDVLSIERL